MKLFPFLLITVMPFSLLSQEVSKEFSKIKLDDEFNVATESWPSTYTGDNLFLVQNGFYELSRQNKKSGAFVFSTKLTEEFDQFELSSRFIFESGKNQTCGLIFQAQATGSGAMVLEINQKKEYRIKRLSTAGEGYITGSNKNQGWTKARKQLNKTDNSITIRTYEKIYDVYFNNKYVMSFSEIEFSRGKVGMYVGPATKLKADYFKVSVGEDFDLMNTTVKSDEDEDKSYSQIIVKLKETLNKKQKEVDQLQYELSTCNRGKGYDTMTMRIMRENQEEISVLQRSLSLMTDTVTILKTENAKLKSFKKTIEDSETGDIIINLTNINNRQKKQIETLESDKSQLAFEVSELKNSNRRLASDTLSYRSRLMMLESRLYEKDSVITSLISELKTLKKKQSGGSGNGGPTDAVIYPEAEAADTIEVHTPEATLPVRSVKPAQKRKK